MIDPYMVLTVVEEVFRSFTLVKVIVQQCTNIPNVGLGALQRVTR